jgi:hypothetical protein
MELLYAAQFAMSAFGAINDANQANADAWAQQEQANKQAAINNQLNTNAHIGINEEQALTLKKHGLDKWELWKLKRRQEAKAAVQATSRGMRGGTAKTVGGSYAAAYNNISRHAYGALARKDLNFEAAIADFGRRHSNVDLTTMNQNNAAFSNLSTGASFLGTALSVAGSGLQISEKYQKGLGTAKPDSGSDYGPSYVKGSLKTNSPKDMQMNRHLSP